MLAGVAAVGCVDPALIPTAPQARFVVESSDRVGVGFNGDAAGFPTGAVRRTGGGSYAPVAATNTPGAATDVRANGGFDCVTSITQGPLAGCARGEGVRWDTSQLLASTTFECTVGGLHGEPRYVAR